MIALAIGNLRPGELKQWQFNSGIKGSNMAWKTITGCIFLYVGKGGPRMGCRAVFLSGPSAKRFSELFGTTREGQPPVPWATPAKKSQMFGVPLAACFSSYGSKHPEEWLWSKSFCAHTPQLQLGSCEKHVSFYGTLSFGLQPHFQYGTANRHHHPL